jgi:predicted  nucleic acid-binding Zn-ribbon protein
MDDDVSLSGSDHATLRRYLQRLEDNIRQITRRLKRFEDEFGMDSEAFYAKLQNAELEEREEYSEWAGEHEALQRLMQQRDELKRRLDDHPSRRT